MPANLIRWLLSQILRACWGPLAATTIVTDVLKDVLWGLLLVPSMP